MMRGRGRGQPFSQPISKPTLVGPEQSYWYWNPNRIGALEAPLWFRAKLREVDPDGFVDIRWNPIRERWAAFYRKPGFSHPICQGWTLLMKVEKPDGSFMPLDERLLAALYNASGRKWGNGKRYFEAIERETEREQEKTEKARTQEAIDIAMPHYDYSQIKNIGKGSKFCDYQS